MMQFDVKIKQPQWQLDFKASCLATIWTTNMYKYNMVYNSTQRSCWHCLWCGEKIFQKQKSHQTSVMAHFLPPCKKYSENWFPTLIFFFVVAHIFFEQYVWNPFQKLQEFSRLVYWTPSGNQVSDWKLVENMPWDDGSIKSIETVQFRWMCTTSFAPLGPKSNCNMLKCHAATLRFIHTILTAGFGYNMVVQFVYTNSARPCRGGNIEKTMAIWNQWFIGMFVRCRSKEKFRGCDVQKRMSTWFLKPQWNGIKRIEINDMKEPMHKSVNEQRRKKNWCMFACRK